MIHRCWFMRKMVNYINWSVFEGRVERPSPETVPYKAPPSPWLPRKFQVLAGLAPGPLRTRTATDGLVARVTLPDRNQPWGGGRFSEVAVLNSWFPSESPGMLGKCRPHVGCSDLIYLECSPEMCMLNLHYGPFGNVHHTLKTTPLRDPTESSSCCHTPACRGQLGFIWSMQWFWFIPEGVFHVHILGSTKRVIRNDQAHIMDWDHTLFTYAINLSIII